MVVSIMKKAEVSSYQVNWVNLVANAYLHIHQLWTNIIVHLEPFSVI